MYAQIHFPNVVCFTSFAIGAPPPGNPSDVPLVNVFAHDLHTLSGSRHANVASQCDFPTSGQRRIKVEVSYPGAMTSFAAHVHFLNGLHAMQPVFTKKLMVRGQYQTLPLIIMGWALPAKTAVKVSTLQVVGYPAAHAFGCHSKHTLATRLLALSTGRLLTVAGL